MNRDTIQLFLEGAMGKLGDERSEPNLEESLGVLRWKNLRQ